jgi:hypothetical protein
MILQLHMRQVPILRYQESAVLAHVLGIAKEGWRA